MNSFERRNKIVDMVNTQGSVLVLDLSNLFGISEVTIRADLRLLEEKGLLTRFHGGAARAGSDLTDAENQEVVLEDRYQLASNPKKRIAHAAAAMIREGMTVILDSGSTTLLIAEALVRMTNITVITNSLPPRLLWQKIKISPWWCAAVPCGTKRIRCTARLPNVRCKVFAPI